MPKISSLLSSKSDPVETTTEETSLRNAAEQMTGKNIGSLVVVDNSEKVVGIITERDIFRLFSRDPEAAANSVVNEIMTRDIIIGVPDDDLDYAQSVMSKNLFRHLPIIDNGKLVGIISIGDIVKTLKSEKEYENRFMRDYIIGNYP